MVKRTGGLRRKTRHKLKKSLRRKSKLSIRDYFQTFKIGEKAVLKAESSIQKGMFAPRFYGKIGIIKAKLGSCYEVANDGCNKGIEE